MLYNGQLTIDDTCMVLSDIQGQAVENLCRHDYARGTDAR